MNLKAIIDAGLFLIGRWKEATDEIAHLRKQLDQLQDEIITLEKQLAKTLDKTPLD